MRITRHRIVSKQPPFQGIANRLEDQAVQCAENEGWPIPDEPSERLPAVAQTCVASRVASRMSRHLRDELQCCSGRPGLRKRVILLGSAVTQAARHDRHLVGGLSSGGQW